MIKEGIINKKYLETLSCLSKKYIELCDLICLVTQVNNYTFKIIIQEKKK